MIDISTIEGLPEGALIQEAHKGGKLYRYVYFPKYIYDKDSPKKWKTSQKRAYIGTVVDNRFVPNKKYRENPELNRQNFEVSPKIRTRCWGPTRVLHELAQDYGISSALEKAYGPEDGNRILSLAMHHVVDSRSENYMYESWARSSWLPTNAGKSSFSISDFLNKIGSDDLARERLFLERIDAVRAKEYLAYDSTKIASSSRTIDDVRLAPSEQGNFEKEIGLALLCAQSSKMPVMYRRMPGNLSDVQTVKDFICRWIELGLDTEATAVLDRCYNSEFNVTSLIDNNIDFIIYKNTNESIIKDIIIENIDKFRKSKYYVYEINGYGIAINKAVPAKTEDEKIIYGRTNKLWFYIFRTNGNESIAQEIFFKRLDEFESEWMRGKASLKDNKLKYYKKPEQDPGKCSLVRNFDEIDRHVSTFGYFAFISNQEYSFKEIMKIYRSRDCVEKTFRGLHKDLEIRSCGVQGDKSLDGLLVVRFIALSLLSALVDRMTIPTRNKEGIDKPLLEELTVNQVLGELRDINIHTIGTMAPCLSEITGKQQMIVKRLGIRRFSTDLPDSI